jgi:hypothetical protein
MPSIENTASIMATFFGMMCYAVERFAITGSAPVTADSNLNVVAESLCMALLGLESIVQ